MAVAAEMWVKIGAEITDFTKKMGTVQKEMDKVASGLTSAGSKLTVGLTAPIVAIGGASLKTSTDFNAAMANVATLIPGNIQRVNELKKSVQDMAVATGKGTTDISGGLYQVISAFGDTSDTAKTLEINLMASAAGLSTVTDAVNLTSAVTKAYGDITAKANEKAADLAFTAVKLGQCLTGSTKILNADGSYKKIEDMAEGGIVISYDGRNFVPMNSKWIYQGIKQTVTLETRMGRKITTTLSHPYLAKKKEWDARSTKAPEWICVNELNIGDKIAVPTTIPFFGNISVPEAEASLLGLWLAEGSGDTTMPCITSTKYGVNIKKWAEKYNCIVKNAEKREDKAPAWRISANSKGYPNGNPIMAMLRKYNISKCKSRDKHIPDEVFKWDRKSLKIFIRWFFNGDGWCYYKKNSPTSRSMQIGICSASETMIRDFSHLLLRFGIMGRIRKRENKWCWETQRYEEVKRFLDTIGIDRDSADKLQNNPPTTRLLPPRGVVEYDKIVSIKMCGEEKVYDLCVEELHNFIANDIVAHNTTFPELAAAIGGVTPFASQLGVTQEELFAGFATLTGVTGGAAEVSTQMAAVLKGMMKPTEDMTKAINSLGYTSASTMVSELGMVGAMREIMATTNGTEEAAGKLFGRAEALTAVFALSSAQSDVFDSKLKDMYNSAGAMTEAFKEQTSGVNAAGFEWSKFQQQLAVTSQNIGDVLAPVMMKLLESLIPVIDAVKRAVDWFSKLDPGVQTIIVTLIALVAALGPVLFVLGQMISTISVLIPVFAALVPVITAVGSALLFLATNPIGIIIAAIAALIAISILIYKNWDEISAWLKKTWEGIKNIAMTVFNAIKDFFIAWGPLILAILTGPIGMLVYVIAKHWDDIKNITSNIFVQISEFTKSIWTSIKDFFVDLFNTLKDFFAKWGPTILTIIAPFIGIPLLIIKNWDAIKEGLANIWESVKSNAISVWDGIKKAILTPVNFIIDDINKLINLINKIPGIKIPAIPTVAVPGYANGTSYAAGGPALVGEKKPEIVNLRRGDTVTPVSKLGGNNINITFTGNVYGMLDFEQRVKKIVRDTAQSGGLRGALENGG